MNTLKTPGDGVGEIMMRTILCKSCIVMSFIIMTGCDLSTAPLASQDERAASVASLGEEDIGETTVTEDQADSQSLSSQSLAITSTMSQELATDLLAAGFSEEESQIVINKATDSATVSANSLAVFSLTTSSPVLNEIAPAFIKGAMEGLSLAGNGLSSSSEKANATELVMTSSMRSLKSHTQGWPSNDRDVVENNVMESGIENIQLSGIEESNYKDAVFAVVKGSVSALETSGVPHGELVSTTQRFVEKSTAILKSAPVAIRVASMAQVSKGSVVGVGSLSLKDEEREVLPSQVAVVVTGATHDLSLTDDDFSSAVSDISYQTGVGIKEVGLQDQATQVKAVEGLAAGISSKIVEISLLGNSSQEFLEKSVPSVSAGVIQSMDSGLMTGENVVSSGVSGKVIAKTLATLEKATLDSDKKITLAGEVASKAVIAAGVAKIDDNLQSSVIADIVKGSTSSLESSGLKADSDLQSAVGLIASKAVEAMSSTGVPKDAYGSATGKIVSSALSGMSKKADVGSSIQRVTEKSLQALSDHQKAGVITSAVLADGAKEATSSVIQEVKTMQNNGDVESKETEKLAVMAADGVVSGLAIGGMSSAETASVRDQVVDQMGGDLANIGVEASKVASIKVSANDKTNDAVEVAQVLTDNTAPSCSLFEKSVSDDDFKSRVDGQKRSQIFCTAVVCPSNRKIEGYQLSWSVFSIEKSLCKMTKEILESDVIALTGGGINLSNISASDVSFQVDAGNLTEVRYKLVTDQDSCLSRSLYSDWEVVKNTGYTLTQTLVPDAEYFLCVDGKRNFQLLSDSQINSLAVTYAVPPSPPTPGANPIVIVEGAYTKENSVTFTLSATEADEMMLATDGSCSSGTWEAYTETANRPISIQNNTNSFSVKYKNLAGETSCSPVASIIHDNQKPVFTTAASVTGQTSVSVPLLWSVSDATSGIMEYQVSIGSLSGHDDVVAWNVVPGPASYTFNSLSLVVGTYYANVKVKDNAGNDEVSSVVFTLSGPTAPTISINSDATYTKNDPVVLTLGATGASEMYITNSGSCSDGGSWESYVTSKSGWALGQTNATTTVYVKYKNAQGFESTCVDDSIIHDSTVPESPSIDIAGGASTNDSTPDLALSATGASEMYITNTLSCNGGGSWEAYTASKSGWPLGQTNATAVVYVKFQDAAGNIGPCISDSIIHDNSGPSNTSIAVAGGAYTNDSTPDLTLGATGASEMYITNTSGCSADGSWEAYETSKSGWALGQTNAVATVYVKYRDDTGNESSCINGSVTHDSIAPAGEYITIDGETYTNDSTPDLALVAAGASEMYITNTSGCTSGGSWEAYAVLRSGWPLSQTNALATVYVKFKDVAGNETPCVNDTITHDSVAPTSVSLVIDGGENISISTPNLTLAATGASEMYITNASGCSANGSWESYATSKSSWALGQSNALATVYVKFKDEAGNESSCESDTVTHDTGVPTGASLTIEGGSHTKDSTVNLTLAVVDATQMYVTNTVGCSADGSWESYVTSKSGWALGQNNALATVYVKFKDEAGNETACVNDTITHDSVAPTSPSLVIEGGNLYTPLSTQTLSLSAVDASEMYVTNSSGCFSGGTWESYAVSKSNWGLGVTNALASVYVMYKDEAGNETPCVSDSITHDDAGPTGGTLTIAEGTHTNQSNIQLNLFANNATQMKLSENANCSGGTWESYAGAKAKVIANSEMNYHFSVKFRDDAENESSCSTASIARDNTPPSISSFVINSDEYTNNVGVYINLTHTGSPTEAYVTTDGSCATNGVWQDITAPVNATLPGGDGAHTLYVKIKDAAGNESSCLSDMITLDQTSPGLPSANVSLTQYIGEVRFTGFSAADTSGIKKYQASLGTTAGGSEVKMWTDILSPDTFLDWVEGPDFAGDLTAGVTYYFNLKAVDYADNVSAMFTHGFIAHDDVSEIHSGVNVNCAVSGNKVKCWGLNNYGQLGIENTNNIGDGLGEMGVNLSAIDVGAGRTVEKMSMTSSHSCAVLDDQTLKCWGSGLGGALGYGDTSNRGYGSPQMGDSLAVVDLGAVSTVQSVSTGLGFSCAILTDNNLKCWGWNSFGQLGNGSTSYVGDGPGEMGINLGSISLGTGRTAQKISLGSWHTCALLDDATVKCWGRNSFGQLGLGTMDTIGDEPSEMGDNLGVVALGTGRTATDIAVGDEFSCALLDNNDVKCWGVNAYGQLGQGNTDTIGDGVGEMGDSLPAIDFGVGFVVEKIAAGGAHACAVSTVGKLKCWGENDEGEVGIQSLDDKVGDVSGDLGDNLIYVDLGAFQGVDESVEHVSVGRDHTCAVLSSGPVKCWGKNISGSLGRGSSVSPIGDGVNEMGDNLPPVELH
ncbi:MAG: RCC1 domain-containing protein [Oligoflexales bacterium]